MNGRRASRMRSILPPGARLLILLGRLEESQNWLRLAVKLSPDLRDAHFELARLLLKKGDTPQAAAAGEIALRLSDGAVAEAPTHYLLIRAWQQSGMPDRAAVHASVMRAQESPTTTKPEMIQSRSLFVMAPPTGQEHFPLAQLDSPPARST